ncbi:MAG: tRNA (N(6)-L-threonylcarbamoyladenosine(37)-C(2))-methylthiotransferase MtaB [Thermodesulfobacteriota bacterium]|nr:tRNA (N(6)-L-threonylcarbamoyladenosine(37)-C(2))-methylthiotransferase MtaB [Thermodesulfobacteriota bacterium]
MKKIALSTLGCKVNQYDSAVIRGLLESNGYTFVPFSQKADVYIINTCTVTNKADYQSRQLIRRSHRLNPDALIIVTGCYSKRAPLEIKEIPGVSYTVGIRDLKRVLALINRVSNRETQPEIKDSFPNFVEHTRAFLKVQDGCNSYCSYCIVPYTRGRSRSISKKDTIRSIFKLEEQGYNEIVLTGIHLGAYGWDLDPQFSLLDLLRSIEEQGVTCRIRLSSIEPMEFNDELIDFISSSRIICNHLHIPLQSGDNDILARMKRPYNILYFKKLIERLVSKIPDLNIGTDIIGGFPGESELNFKNTIDLIEKLPLGYIHVFPYSRRPGTIAASFPFQIDGKTIANRTETLRTLGQKKKESFYNRFTGKRLSVLIESKRDNSTGYLKGFSRNYISVLIDASDDQINKEMSIRVTHIKNGRAFGVMNG